MGMGFFPPADFVCSEVSTLTLSFFLNGLRSHALNLPPGHHCCRRTNIPHSLTFGIVIAAQVRSIIQHIAFENSFEPTLQISPGIFRPLGPQRCA